MANGFDPYHKWLGIPPKDQPPHHYRLLGVELLESDLDVIENAADQRMRHVRSFQNGPHQAESQQLLNEIARAKVCLLDPQQKAQYDAYLAKPTEEEEYALKPLPGEFMLTPLPPQSFALTPLPTVAPQAISTATTPRRRAAPKNPLHELLKIAAGGIAGLLLAVVILGFLREDWDMLGIAKAVRGSKQTIKKPREQVVAPVPPPVEDPGKITESEDTLPDDDTVAPPRGQGPGKKQKKKGGPGVAPANQLTPLAGDVATSTFTWERGDEARQVGSAADSFAVFSWITGHFLGNGEWLHLTVEDQQFVLHGGAAMKTGGTVTRVRSPYRAWFEEKLQEVSWEAGNGPIRLIHEHDGFAVLSGVQGCFLGPEHAVEVYLNPQDGYWYLDGRTNFASAGHAQVYRFKRPGAFRAKVTSIDWPGSPEQPLIGVTEGLVFISSISGRYAGYGESLHVQIDTQGRWRAWGVKAQPTTSGKFIQIEFNTPELLTFSPEKPNLQWMPEQATPLPMPEITNTPPATTEKQADVAGGQPKSLPPPSDAELATTKQQIAEIFRDEHAKAKTPQQKLALAEKLRDAAINTSQNPTEQFALLVIARDIAASAGDWEVTGEMIARLHLRFDIDALAMADEARVKIDAAAQPPRNPRAAYGLLIDLISAAEMKERYDVAERLLGSAQRIVRRGGDTQTLKQLEDYSATLQKQRRQYEALKPALAALQTDPTDVKANLAVGSYRALVQGNWREGLPMLARGSDAELAKLATEELAQPSAGPAQLALADSWWNLAEQRKNEGRSLRRHALDWYLRASHQLTGLNQGKALARLEGAEKWHSKEAALFHPALIEAFDRSHPALPSLLNDSEQYHVDQTSFAIHLTGVQSYFTIDLKREVPITRLQILNRQSHSYRSRGLRVYVSSSPQQRGELIWQAPDDAQEWNVLLPQMAVGRYVTITLDPMRVGDAYLHLRKVKIFGPE